MRIFLSIKFWGEGDLRNQKDVRKIINIIDSLGHETFCIVEHAENWGEKSFSPEQLMKMTFSEIEISDLLIANVAHWPIGVGVEVGYAAAKGIPIICICPQDMKLANTVAGVAETVIRYSNYPDLRKKLMISLAE